MIESRCGLLCSQCSYREPFKCGGCVETNGQPFHGECPVATCCQNKGLCHCGQCPEFPCRQLHAYAYHEEHGDNGARIEQCEKWSKEGV